MFPRALVGWVMNSIDVIKSAISNTFRSKVRTSLTVVAIFIGAFTLTITSALGSGISNYIDDQLGSIGASDIMMVTAKYEQEAAIEGPTPYDPDAPVISGPGSSGAIALGDADLETIADIDGVLSVEPVRFVSVSYIQNGDSGMYEISINPMTSATIPDIAAGTNFTSETKPQLLLEESYLSALDFADAEAAVGQTVTLGVMDPFGVHQEISVEITGVLNPALLPFGAGANQALIDEVSDILRAGTPEGAPAGYLGALIHFDPDATDDEISALKDRLDDAGFEGVTTADQIGQFQTIVSGIIGVLNGFAFIALLAAGFGIINTLFMSVQERTREIGLMKAMGMGSGRVFALFSVEAVFIGFLGSALGAGIAIVLGIFLSDWLSKTALADLPGLNILTFEPLPVAIVILVVMLIAFLAGTLPARRAAAQNPIDALRYE